MVTAVSPQYNRVIQRASRLMLSILLVAGTATVSAGDKGMQNIQFRKVIDLSQPISPTIPLWPGDPPVEFETVATQAKEGYFLRRFSMGEHSGTHMNAPNSFHPDGIGIDAYSPESLVRPAVVIDVREQAKKNPDYVVAIADIEAWERANGRIAADSIVVFYTGWQAFWKDPERFFNKDDKGLHFPGVGADTTAYLLEKRQAVGIGIDTHGADPGMDEAFGTNMQVLAKNGIILENLTNLDQLPAKGTTLVIGVLRLKDGSGSPVSVMAFAP